MTKLLEKTILEDKVDLIFAPWGTAMLYSYIPIATKHKYILLGGPGSALKLKEIIDKVPYFFLRIKYGGHANSESCRNPFQKSR